MVGLRVDIHSHVTSPDIIGKAGRYGPERTIDAEGRVTFRVGHYASRSAPGKGLIPNPQGPDPIARLADMDKRGIDIMGVTVSPLCYMYWAEPEVGVPFASVVNDSLAKFCQADPDRLFFIPTIPLQDIDASLKELDRAVAMNGKGVNIGTDNIAGRNLDDETLLPLFERIAKYDMPVFLHPYPSGIETGASDRYNLSWITGYVHQETVAFCHITYSGLLDRFPNLKICVPHGGGMVPYQIGRLDYAMSRMPDVKAKRSLADYLPNFYFDTVVHDIRARRYLLEFMTADNLMVGSNYLGWDAVDGFALVDELDLDEADHRKIVGENAIRIFKLR